MKIAIIYKSLTGNTKMLADKIKETVSKEDIIYVGEPKDNIDADLYFVASWTDKGMCSKEIADFLKKLENKKIAYFGTAGFGGDTKYYDTIFNRIKSIIPESNDVIGYFFCQGKMPIQVRERYVALIKEHPDDKNLQVSVENFDKALSHPDEKDLEDVKEWVNDIL